MNGKRLFDLCLALALLPIVAPVALVVAILVRVTSPGQALHRSVRVGRRKSRFDMYKFRTMKIDTPDVATHLLEEPDRYLTPIGAFLRKTSLDEAPQLYNIIRGDMSFVGPRPALHNQDDLVALRDEKGINDLTPGLTGWAQINGRDELSIPDKVAFEAEYIKRRSFGFDLYIIGQTIWQVFGPRGVSH